MTSPDATQETSLQVQRLSITSKTSVLARPKRLVDSSLGFTEARFGWLRITVTAKAMMASDTTLKLLLSCLLIFMSIAGVMCDADENPYFTVADHEECVVGFWGQDCRKQCGWCKDNGGCLRSDGTCYSGRCTKGFRGAKCVEPFIADQLSPEDIQEYEEHKWDMNRKRGEAFGKTLLAHRQKRAAYKKSVDLLEYGRRKDKSMTFDRWKQQFGKAVKYVYDPFDDELTDKEPIEYPTIVPEGCKSKKDSSKDQGFGRP